jgi:hypothetical protein
LLSADSRYIEKYKLFGSFIGLSTDVSRFKHDRQLSGLMGANIIGVSAAVVRARLLLIGGTSAEEA